jgi:hypothetical protein
MAPLRRAHVLNENTFRHPDPLICHGDIQSSQWLQRRLPYELEPEQLRLNPVCIAPTSTPGRTPLPLFAVSFARSQLNTNRAPGGDNTLTVVARIPREPPLISAAWRRVTGRRSYK